MPSLLRRGPIASKACACAMRCSPLWRRTRPPARRSGAGARGLRRLRPLPPARAARLLEAADRALPRDEVRAPPLLPVRARGGLARPRLRERLLRSLADDPARLEAGRGPARGARA